MNRSECLITDLKMLAHGEFSAETQSRAKLRLAAEENLYILLGKALARASELKMTLMKVETIVDSSDPMASVLQSILAALN